MKTSKSTRPLCRSALALAAVLALLGPAQAQLSTATLQGQVTQSGSAAGAGVAVVAVNTATGNASRTVTRADGSYVLSGLPPGTYEIRIGDRRSQAVTLAVGEVASLDLSADGSQQVVITGSITRKDVRNSEVGTGVTRRTIELAPQITRNFLSFAELAPGVRLDGDTGTGFVSLRSGAQDRNNVNVYIDGVSQKNNILRGGASAMDSSRGNPFPQTAVAEYKVISQNYKAEFDQVSSAAITAVTKSGGNEVHGEVFWDVTGDRFTAYTPAEREQRAAGADRVKFKQHQYGLSVGGPIKTDVAHYFVAYEAKDIASPRTVTFSTINPPVPDAGFARSLFPYQGSYEQKFKEHLVLGKLDLELEGDHHVDATVRLRREDDLIPEDVSRSAPGNDKNRKNDETRLDLRHTLSRDTYVNEARLGYEDYRWQTQSDTTSPEIKYFISASNTTNDKALIVSTGGTPDGQDRRQKGWLAQNDFTYSGLAGHTVKTGAKVKLMRYELGGTNRKVDIYSKLLNKTTGNPITGLDPTNPAADFFQWDKALPATEVNYRNTQFGMYLQDDWKVSRQLELNLGVRWDFETNPLNNDFRTPAALVAALRAPDITRYGITPAPGQTYAQSLAKGGVDIDAYINDGTKRRKFYGAIAPRLGFSYDIAGDANTVVFGGYGRAYDRAMANHALDELQRSLVNGDQFLIRNDYKMPFSDQFALGLRQALGEWNGEIGWTRTEAKNQFNWIPGDRDPNGGWGKRGGSIDPNWGAGPQGYGMLILGDFVTRQRTTQLYLRADKPYTPASGWSAGVTYTYSDGRTTHRDWNDDIFNWGYGKPGDTGGFHPSRLVERHRVVASGVVDGLLPWGLLLGGRAAIGSGLPYRVAACPDPVKQWDECYSFYGKPAWTHQYDLSLTKGFKVPGGEFLLRMDVINLFNSVNWTQYDDWGGNWEGPPFNQYGGNNMNVGKRTGTGLPMRTLKFSLRYVF